MKKKLLSAILATAMMATVLTGCGGSNEQPAAAPAAEEPAAEAPAAEEPAAEAPAAEAPAAEASDSLADKKVGVCIYQFSDNFMTLFRTELENYLIAQGFSKDNINIVDGANDQIGRAHV